MILFYLITPINVKYTYTHLFYFMTSRNIEKAYVKHFIDSQYKTLSVPEKALCVEIVSKIFDVNSNNNINKY